MIESSSPLQPYDSNNQKLRSNVHPEDWENPIPRDSYHLVVIGAGTAGLVTAAGAAGLGARVALVERDLMGGDCLNVGCVPSKGLIGAARAIAAAGDGQAFGVTLPQPPVFDFGKAMERMRQKRAQISPADSADRFKGLGVDVFFGNASFENNNTVTLETRDGKATKLNFRKAVIATGARAAAPPINGLEAISFLNNETLFSLTQLPPRLGVIGGGPIGCEMAQSFARFGSEVYMFERSDKILPREDELAASIVQKQFEKDGIKLLTGANEMHVRANESGAIAVCISRSGKAQEFVVDELLVAVGRAPNVEDLNLEKVGVKFGSRGIDVNEFLQTANPKIYAAGDVCSKYQFTHAADFQARIVIQNALFALGPFGRKKASRLVIPWATYTSPEVAHVGTTPEEAAAKGIEIDVYTQPFEDIDRAILEGNDRGFVKVLTRKGSDKILGATIVSEHAGDLISEITVAMKNDVGLSGIGSTIHPYPTYAEAIRKLGDQYNKTKLTPFASKILKLLMLLNVGK